MSKKKKILIWLILGIPALIFGVFGIVKYYYFSTWKKYAIKNGKTPPESKRFWTEKFSFIKISALAAKDNNFGSLEGQ